MDLRWGEFSWNYGDPWNKGGTDGTRRKKTNGTPCPVRVANGFACDIWSFPLLGGNVPKRVAEPPFLGSNGDLSGFGLGSRKWESGAPKTSYTWPMANQTWTFWGWRIFSRENKPFKPFFFQGPLAKWDLVQKVIVVENTSSFYIQTIIQRAI